MAELAKLEIQIGADVKDATKGIDNLNRSLSKLEFPANKLKKGAADASAALFSVSQVARDLPFGFIAIQNNLPQVVDSFASLTKQSGGVFNALKALGGALLGPAGIGFAFSAITSAATALIQKYGSLAEGLDALFSSTTAVEGAQRDIAKAFREAEAGTVGEISKLTQLTQVLTDNLRPQEERKNAYIQLKKEYPGIIQDMTAENALTEAGSQLILQRAEEVKKYILIKGKEAALIKLIEKATLEQLESEQRLDKIRGRATGSLLDFVNPLAFNNAVAIGKTAVAIDKAKESSDEYAKKLVELRDETLKLDQTVIGIDPFKGSKEKIDKSLNELLKAQIRSAEASLKLEELTVIERFKIRGRIIDLQEKLDKLEATQSIKNKRALNATLIAIDKEAAAKREGNTITRATITSDDQLSGTLKGTAEQFERIKKLLGVPLKLDVNIAPFVKGLTEAELKALNFAADTAAIMKEFSEQVKSILEQGAIDGLTNLGLALGEMAAGKGLEQGLKKVFSGVGQILVDLGKTAIQTGIAMLNLKKAFAFAASNPALMIAAGVALAALGNVVKSKFAATAFAEGGVVTKPTLAMIGEAGEKEAVIPLSKLEGMIGGGFGGGGMIQGRLSGSDILLSVIREQKKQKRG